VDRLLARADLRLVPADFMFGFADTGAADRAALPALPVQIGHWISTGPATVIVESLQQRHEVRLEMEVFDGPPDEENDVWEVDHTTDLEVATGRITVITWNSGQLRDVLTLPQPGVYRVRVSGRNRAAVAQEHEALYATHDIDDPDFAAAFQRLAGKETYRVAFWPAAGRVTPDSGAAG
jgi:hypothetical protein